MGAGQSSETSNAQTKAEVKTSYYELLSVQRTATDDEIKKAYRRKALELHPDRNYGNEANATRIFAEVQAAYEILSDPQERAWYDSHEAAILRGDDGSTDEVHSYENVRVTTADDLARVLRKFNSSVDFSDSPSGFFGFLHEQFDQLAKEEEIAAAWDNVEARDYPTFGHKDDQLDDVVKKFYAAWVNFSTVKSFAWKDKYRLSEAPDRRIRRLMEKENMNARQEAIKEFNEAVRTFVLFVRKRDPRYTPSTQSEAERQKILRDAASAQAARARAANQAALQGEVPAWAQYREPDELLESSEEEVEQEVIECVACNKTFKSERQYEAHEKSKKHQKAIQALQRQMRKDNASFNIAEVKPSVDEAEWELIGSDGDAQLSDVSASETSISDTADGHEAASLDSKTTDKSPGTEEAAREVSSADAMGVVTEEMASSTLKDSVESESDGEAAASTAASDGGGPRKMGKAALKRAKKAAAAANSEAESANNKCATCDAAFPSRTRLFQHIKDHGHAALKPAASGSAKNKKGKKQG